MTKTLKTFALAAALAFASVGAHAQSVVQDPSFDTVIGQGPWYVGSGAPVANGTATLAAGQSYHLYVSGFGTGMQLDNLSVTAVPEPESYARFAAGLAALGLLARRRKTAYDSLVRI